jgi:predicted CoA-binding protein
VIKRLLTTPATWAVVGLSANTKRTAYSIGPVSARAARHEHRSSQSSR